MRSDDDYIPCLQAAEAASRFGGNLSASPETLVRQASYTADAYFHNAIINIDATFGEGYAKANPQLVGAYIQAAAADFQAAILANINNQLRIIADAIRGEDD